MVRATIMIDCGRHSGLGRVRRTLTLLGAFRSIGVEPRIFLSDEEGSSLVQEQGYSFEVGVPDDLANDILIIDTCTQTPDEVSALCARARVSCVIDDLGERPVACDYLINPNLYAACIDYSAYAVRKVFYGPTHSLLSSEFFDHGSDDENREGIVVSFGGTDNGRLAAAVAQQLSERTSEQICVPVPDYLQPAAALVQLSNMVSNVILLHSPSMPALLRKSRLYVGAAGATVLEALASGCKVCVAATQEDQVRNIEYLPSVGVPALGTFHADAMAAMAEQLLYQDRPGLTFNVDAPLDIATAALETYHQAV